MLPLRKSLLRFSAAVRVSYASSCSVTSDGSKLRLVCDDEPERRYHSQWLRYNCRCPVCLPPSIQQNVVHHRNLIGLKITNATMESDERVMVKWESKNGPHSCYFDVNWLKDHDYTTRPGVQEKRIKDETPLVAKSLPTLDYKDVMGSTEGYYEWMKEVNHYGMALVQNVPIKEHGCLPLTNKIAPPQVHPYALIYDVLSKDDPDRDPSDFAYTTNELLMHMDQGYLESQPGIQILYCLRFDDCVKGGESIIIDTVPVLEEFRNKHPKHFETLTRVPYIVNRYYDCSQGIFYDGLNDIGEIRFKFSQPHISLDHYGQVCSISWSPQFHYPLAATEKETEEYFEAFILLSEMFEVSPTKLIHRLQPGEALLMNNRRVLHSRNSIKLNGGVRHLQGYYIDTDFFLSALRTLSNRLNKTDPIKRMFNRSHIA